MNASCIFVLALALFGALSEGYMYSGVGYNGVCGTGTGLATGYGVGYGAGVGVGYGAGGYAGEYEAGYVAPAVCDTCQCVKTIVRPTIERIPYSCARRVQPTARAGYGLYPGAVYGRPAGVLGTGAVRATTVETGSGYINNGYVV